jgi:hypothetical protein
VPSLAMVPRERWSRRLGLREVHFRFPDAPAKALDWWMVITADDADVCLWTSVIRWLRR